MTTIKLETFVQENFINIESGDREVSMTIFDNRYRVGSAGWATNVALTPAQAREIGEALIKESTNLVDSETERE